MTNDKLQSLESRYQIITELGRGGVSIVYKAKDLTLDRIVALKTLSAQSLSEKKLVQFQSEARALSGLKHKGIMEILDFGVTENGIAYMVLEYIEGIPLSKYIEDVGPVPLIMNLSIFSNLCQSLNHAHNKGVLHRDLKPSNIILVSKGDSYFPKIIDFGLAVLQNDEVSPESNTQAAGSPPYMSPEQIDNNDLDQRSDIYSLGCTFFESLTGEVPYKGDTAFETMNLHKNSPIPKLKKISNEPEIQTALQSLIDRSLAKNKTKRYQFVIAMQKAIDEILERANEIAATKNQIESDKKQITSKKTSLKTFYAIALLLALGSAAFYYSSIQSVQKDKSALEAEVQRRKKSEELQISSTKSGEQFAGAHLGGSRMPMPDIYKMPLSTHEIEWDLLDVKGFDFTKLKRFPRLDTLKLKECDVTPEQFAQICTLSSLEALEFNWDENVCQADFSLLQKLPRLHTLRFPCDKLDKEHILILCKLKNIQSLNLQKNEGVDEDVIKALAKMPRLFKLKIGANAGIQGKAMRGLGELSNLRELYVDLQNLDDDTTIYLASKLQKLVEISVGHTFITIKGLRALCKIPTIELINISGCKNLQDDASLDSIEILSRTNKRLTISSQSQILKD